MKKVLLGCLLLSACEPIQPDYVDKNGKEYMFTKYCVKSHSETQWGYHYGYNFMSSKYEWHNGMYDETICDSSAIDTIEINKDKKFYAKKSH